MKYIIIYIYIYICLYTYTCLYIYIYIYIKRTKQVIRNNIFKSMHLYIYIILSYILYIIMYYIYIYIICVPLFENVKLEFFQKKDILFKTSYISKILSIALSFIQFR